MNFVQTKGGCGAGSSERGGPPGEVGGAGGAEAPGGARLACRSRNRTARLFIGSVGVEGVEGRSATISKTFTHV